MSRPISRRQLLRLIAATAATAALAPAFHARAHYPRLCKEDTDLWVWMGRAIHPLTFYSKPATSSDRLNTCKRDDFFPIIRHVRAPFSAHNTLWYETPLGYVHSAWVHPVRIYPPQPFIRDVGEWGFWGEVIQPYTEAYLEPRTDAKKIYRFYGNTVYRVIKAFEDTQGVGWYKVFDEFPMQDPPYQWVLARDVRRIPRSEMAPIRPFVGNKRIEIDLSRQRLTCYEGDRPVLTTLVSAGRGIQPVEIRVERDGVEVIETVNVDMTTPIGDAYVILKQPSRHMTNRPMRPDAPPPLVAIFDLPGVPWNLFFNLDGTAIHGTYWHNDFGIKRSHGCVNVPTTVARWLYRWVYPIGGFEDDFIQSDRRVGTLIRVF